MVRYKGTQASHLHEKSMHTQCAISEQPLHAEASTILDQSPITHLCTFSDTGVYVALQQILLKLLEQVIKVIDEPNIMVAGQIKTNL